jgi:predicted glycosyltransferase
MKLLVYSHDAYGLGNIRRMLDICHYLLQTIPNLSILVLSGSPMLQSFRLPKGLDYIKLPCLHRDEEGNLSAKYLKLDMGETVQMRGDLILTTALNFKPDLVLVDKKPYGLKDELRETIETLKASLPETKWVLLLRDILDHPERTILEWQQLDSYQAIQSFYDQVLVVGTPEVFNPCVEYKFSAAIAAKVKFCGYMRRPPGLKSRNTLRQEFKMALGDRCVLVTAGGGEDGYPLIRSYLEGLALLPKDYRLKSIVICGPEMAQDERESLYEMAKQYPQVEISEFTDDLMSYVAAADTVVAMGGYNTFCEILSAQKPSIIVPRIVPSEEQLIRAKKMGQMGLLKAILPEELTPKSLMESIFHQLSNPSQYVTKIKTLDLNALPRISHYISTLHPDKVFSGKIKNSPEHLEYLCA